MFISCYWQFISSLNQTLCLDLLQSCSPIRLLFQILSHPFLLHCFRLKYLNELSVLFHSFSTGYASSKTGSKHLHYPVALSTIIWLFLIVVSILYGCTRLVVFILSVKVTMLVLFTFTSSHFSEKHARDDTSTDHGIKFWKKDKTNDISYAPSQRRWFLRIIFVWRCF